MPSIQVIGVTKAYGSKRLFQEVTVNFSERRRYGLTGPNGAGKTTFLKILSGDLEPDAGSVARPERTSVLRQDQFAFEEQRGLSVVLMGNKRLWAAMQEKEHLLERPKLTDDEGRASASSNAQSRRKTATRRNQTRPSCSRVSASRRANTRSS